MHRTAGGICDAERDREGSANERAAKESRDALKSLTIFANALDSAKDFLRFGRERSKIDLVSYFSDFALYYLFSN